MGCKGGGLHRRERTESASVGSHPFMTSFSMIVQTCSLSERFSTVQTCVRLVTGVNSRMSLQRRGLPESFPAYLTTIWPLTVVFSRMAKHGGFVTKSFVAHRAFERFFPRMLAKMIVQVHPSLERLVARWTGKVPDIFVMRSHMSRQTRRLTEGFATIFTANLAPDAMSSKVVAKGVAVSVLLRADVTLWLLTFMR